MCFHIISVHEVSRYEYHKTVCKNGLKNHSNYWLVSPTGMTDLSWGNLARGGNPVWESDSCDCGYVITYFEQVTACAVP